MNRPEPKIHAADTDTTYLLRMARQRPSASERDRTQHHNVATQEGSLSFDLPVSPTNENSGAVTQPAYDVSEPPRQHALLTRAELKRQERDAIIAALKQTNGKISGSRGAAELLGMKPSTFSSRMAALGLNREMLGLAN